MINKLISVLALVFVCTPAWSAIRYVTDVVPVRSGAGSQYQIIHPGIRSGAKLELLENPDGNWARIRTEAGMEGWVPKQYLKDSPTAQLQLDATKVQLNEAVSKTQTLEKQLQNLKTEHENLAQQSEQQAQEQDAYAADMLKLQQLAADAVSLNQRYQEILTRHELIQTEFDAVKAENDRLKADQTVNHWLFGAGLMILGMILMLVLPSLKPKKRHSEWIG